MNLKTNTEIRFLVTGGLNTLVGFGLFTLFQIWWGQEITYMGSLVLSHLIASLFAFYFYRKWVFKVEGQVWKDFLRFQTIYLGSFTANLLLLPLLISTLNFSPITAQAVSISVIAISSYFGHRFFSFKRRHR